VPPIRELLAHRKGTPLSQPVRATGRERGVSALVGLRPLCLNGTWTRHWSKRFSAPLPTLPGGRLSSHRDHSGLLWYTGQVVGPIMANAGLEVAD
jgi:hypothetical protein